VFLNCGGQEDLTQLWFYNSEYGIQVYLFDSHRPIHHRNMIDEQRMLLIINDGCKSFSEYPDADDDRYI
jgi:hypothetical protein